jgi:hypothetical protein
MLIQQSNILEENSRIKMPCRLTKGDSRDAIGRMDFHLEQSTSRNSGIKGLNLGRAQQAVCSDQDQGECALMPANPSSRLKVTQ